MVGIGPPIDGGKTPPRPQKRTLSSFPSPRFPTKRPKPINDQSKTHLPYTEDKDSTYPIHPTPALLNSSNAASRLTLPPPHANARPSASPAPYPWPTFSTFSHTVPVIMHYFPLSRIAHDLPSLYIITPIALPRITHTVYHHGNGIEVDLVGNSKAWNMPAPFAQKCNTYTTYAVGLLARQLLTIDFDEATFFAVPVLDGFVPNSTSSVEAWVKGIAVAQINEIELGHSRPVTTALDLVDAVLYVDKNNFSYLFASILPSQSSSLATWAPLPLTINTEEIPQETESPFRPHRAPEIRQRELNVSSSLSRSAISLRTYRALSFIPHLLYQLSHAAAIEVLNCDMFWNLFDSTNLREALTTATANAGYDYQFLEFVGDSLGGLITGLDYICVRHDRNGKNAHAAVSNQSLLKIVHKTNILRFLCASAHDAKTWYSAHNFKVNGKSVRPACLPWIDNKIKMDIVESTLGALVMSGPLGRLEAVAIPVMKVLGFDLGSVSIYTDFRVGWNRIPPHASYRWAGRLSSLAIQGLQHCLKRHFGESEIELIREAFVFGIEEHESNRQSRLRSIGIEALKFFAVMFVSQHLCERTESLVYMSFIKDQMISNDLLAAVCVMHGLHDYLLNPSYVVEDDIRVYVAAHAAALKKGRWWTLLPSMKVLSEMMQRLLGALFVIHNFKIEEMRKDFDLLIVSAHDWGSLEEYERAAEMDLNARLFELYGCSGFHNELVTPSQGFSHRCDVYFHQQYLTYADGMSGEDACSCAVDKVVQALNQRVARLAQFCDCPSMDIAGANKTYD